MNAEQIRRVRESFAKITPHAERLGAAFYETLFRINPASRALFPQDMASQARKLTDMLGAIVDGLDDSESLHRMFHELGRRHVGYGVEESHYDDVGVALLQALRSSLAEDFTDDVEDAWATVYGDLAETMIAAAGETVG
jgi:hemoglobin-like flavoprotein